MCLSIPTSPIATTLGFDKSLESEDIFFETIARGPRGGVAVEKNGIKNPNIGYNERMKVALVHDQLREFGGAERVLVSLKKIFPQADVYTTTFDLNSLGSHKSLIKN